MTAEYTPDQTPPRQCPECGGLSGHTADCPNRVDDRAVVVAEALAAHQTEQLWKQGGWAGDTACSCGWRMAMWSRKDFPEVHREHQAAAILAALDGAPA